ncbi:MAG: hypothetical protein HZC28_18550 [Spirochaetes bacterium]|nr:hypothetical protein [Spirochaetota bacterium]
MKLIKIVIPALILSVFSSTILLHCSKQKTKEDAIIELESRLQNKFIVNYLINSSIIYLNTNHSVFQPLSNSTYLDFTFLQRRQDCAEIFTWNGQEMLIYKHPFLDNGQTVDYSILATEYPLGNRILILYNGKGQQIDIHEIESRTSGYSSSNIFFTNLSAAPTQLIIITNMFIFLPSPGILDMRWNEILKIENGKFVSIYNKMSILASTTSNSYNIATKVQIGFFKNKNLPQIDLLVTENEMLVANNINDIDNVNIKNIISEKVKTFRWDQNISNYEMIEK